MQTDSLIQNSSHEVTNFFARNNAMRSVLILAVLLIVAYWLSKYLGLLLVKLAQSIALHSDTTPDAIKKIKLRRIETYLSIAVATVRALTVGVVAFYSWKILSPTADSSTAAIGASAFFIVLAGGTVGLVLRDITSGAAMVAERWFDVGDYIRVEPFWDVNGIVERITLRSTKLRNINGEVIWLHNQYIQGVKVTPRGVRTIVVDVFVNNEKVGINLVEKAVATVPVGTIKVTKKPKINKPEKWGDRLWLISVKAQTPPGREWLIEQYFIDSLVHLDKKRQGPDCLVRQPIARYADKKAEASFSRAVQAADD